MYIHWNITQQVSNVQKVKCTIDSMYIGLGKMCKHKSAYFGTNLYIQDHKYDIQSQVLHNVLHQNVNIFKIFGRHDGPMMDISCWQSIGAV